MISRYKSPLCRAAKGGRLDLVKLLVEYGAAIEQFTAEQNEGMRLTYTAWPLLCALEEGHFDIANFLLINGSTKTFQENPRYLVSQPLHYCSEKGNTDEKQSLACAVAKQLLQLGAKASVYRRRVFTESKESVDANLNSTEYDFTETPLHIAVDSGFSSMVQVLVENGGSEQLAMPRKQLIKAISSVSVMDLCKNEEMKRVVGELKNEK